MEIQTVKWVKELVNTSKNHYLIVVKDGVKTSVPLDPDNRHYQEVQEWVAEGNTIEEGE